MTDFVILQLPASLQGPPHASSTYSEARFALHSPRKEHDPWMGELLDSISKLLLNCCTISGSALLSPCVKEVEETSANCSETLRRKERHKCAFNNLILAVPQLSHSRISPRSQPNTCARGLQNTVILRRWIDRQKDRA